MNNKYLIAWVIPLLLLGSSCKKQEKLSQEKVEKQIQKTDLIGAWKPTKIETSFVDEKKQEISRVDSSDNVKFYVPNYQFTTDKVNVDHKTWDYNIITSDHLNTLEYLRFGIPQHFEILKLNTSLLILRNVNKEETGIRTDVIYFKKG